MLLSGDAWLVHNWNGDIYRVAVENPDIKYVIPKSAQNKELAHAFINFLLEPEVDARIHSQIQYLTPNKAAFPFMDESLRSTMEKMTPEIAEKLEYIEDLGKETRLWD